jgi:hypothetical protein
MRLLLGDGSSCRDDPHDRQETGGSIGSVSPPVTALCPSTGGSIGRVKPGCWFVICAAPVLLGLALCFVLSLIRGLPVLLLLLLLLTLPG